VDAFDGNPGTPWMSLPDLPMPQWLEIDLPERLWIGAVQAQVAPGCSGQIILNAGPSSAEAVSAPFAGTGNGTVSVSFEPPVLAGRIRVRVDTTGSGANSATVYETTWRSVRLPSATGPGS
jgi:hypothetical protein